MSECPPDAPSADSLFSTIRTPFNTPASVLYNKPKKGTPEPKGDHQLANELQDKLNQHLITQRIQALDLKNGVSESEEEVEDDDYASLDLNALQQLHDLYTHEQEIYFHERKELEKRFMQRCAPIFKRRADVIQGLEENQDKVADFWLTALSNNSIIRQHIDRDDIDILAHLVDIQTHDLDSCFGFRLEFHFERNPYFENQILTKTYVVPNLFGTGDRILETTKGTKIKWLAVPETTSFFEFFDAPWMELMENNSPQDLEDHIFEELHEKVENDLRIGLEFHQKIVPDAVFWFTGDANTEEFEDEEESEFEIDAGIEIVESPTFVDNKKEEACKQQ